MFGHTSRFLGLILVQSLLAGFPAPTGFLWGQAPAAPTEPAGAAASGSQSVGADEVVLSVGPKTFTAAEFEKLIAALPPQYSGAANTFGKKGFADQYANLLSLALEGEKRKIDQQESFRQMSEFQRVLLLAQVTLNELTNSAPVSPDDVKSYYTSHQAEFEEAKVRGIYVAFEGESLSGAQEMAESSGSKEAPKRTEAEAKAKAEALRAQIQGGEDMAALAKTDSDHATGSQGGELGYVRRAQLVAEMAETIFSLPAKEVSAPVRDRSGYFIFQVEEKRLQPLEQAQQNIENSLRQQKTNDLLAKVRNDYPVTLNPRYFPEAPAGNSPTQPGR
ncbi:MAG: peptidylprolyl isomerase [Acidobacteria bacterium]|nr:peptidylprolyl isomerase [Acidobacteriota bacterium]